MIKNVYIKNIKGLRGEHHLNFEIKELKQSQIDKEKSIGEVNGVKIMKAPIFIAKNASGKTTILEAIDLAMKFNSLEQLLKERSRAVIRRGYLDYAKMIDDFRIHSIEKLIDINDNGLVGNVLELGIAENVTKLVFGLNLIFSVQGSSLKIDRINSISRESILKLKNQLIDKLDLHFKNIVCVDISSLDPFLNFNEEFEIKIEFINGKMASISNNGLAKKEVKEIFLKMLTVEIETMVLSPLSKMFDILFSVAHNTVRDVIDELVKMGEKGLITTESEDKDQGYTSYILESAFQSSSQERVSSPDFYKDMIERITFKMGDRFLEKIFKILDKQISHIEYKESGISIVSIDGQIISHENLSFGIKKVLSIFSFAIQNKNNGFIMIDDIENGVNISLIRLIYSFLDEINLQVISTTHDPSIIHQEILSPQNAFVNIGSKFVTAKSILKTKRPENLVSFFRPANYANDFYIVANAVEGFSTNSISSTELDELLDSAQELL